MDSKQVKDLMEAYASVYSSLNEEEMEDAENEGKEKEGKESGKDEGGKHKEGKHKKGKEEPGEKKTEKEDVEEGLNPIAVNKEPKKGGPSTLGQLIGDKLAGDKSFTKGKPPTAVVHGIKKEEVETDLFDVILEYLVAEGYADTNKAALAIMANMSEEWKQSIVEMNLSSPLFNRPSNRIDGKPSASKLSSDTRPVAKPGMTPMQRLQSRPDTTIR